MTTGGGTYRIATIPGDGVGPEVVAAARRVVDAAGGRFGFTVDWSEHVVGGIAIDAFGVAIRDEDVAACGEADAILLGAVDAALQPALGWHPTLTEYEIKAVSAGEDAQGQVLVRCRRSSDEGPGALIVTGHGLSTNIIEASLEGYLVAVNKLHGAEINGVSVAFVSPRQGETLP